MVWGLRGVDHNLVLAVATCKAPDFSGHAAGSAASAVTAPVTVQSLTVQHSCHLSRLAVGRQLLQQPRLVQLC